MAVETSVPLLKAPYPHLENGADRADKENFHTHSPILHSWYPGLKATGALGFFVCLVFVLVCLFCFVSLKQGV